MPLRYLYAFQGYLDPTVLFERKMSMSIEFFRKSCEENPVYGTSPRHACCRLFRARVYFMACLLEDCSIFLFENGDPKRYATLLHRSCMVT